VEKGFVDRRMDWTISIAWTFGILMVVTTAFCPLLRREYAFLLGALLYSLVDVVMGSVGVWTLMCALSWGIIGILFNRFQPSGKLLNFLGMSFAGTIAFDFLTGVIGGPLLFPMSFADAFIGQIPFTISHLIGNLVIVGLLAPLVYAFVAMNPSVKKALSERKIYSPAIFVEKKE
jgi:hypothetical protein